MTTSHALFKGFDDFIELFRAGRQTDSAGVAREFTTADLDQIVANHDPAHPAPLVVGHPKTDDPAYGWSAQIKRVGDVLLGKFSQVEPQFEQLVREGRYRNRSVKLVKTGKGWRLGHIGFLGAVPPAVPGLKPVYAAAEDGEICEFTYRDAYKSRWLARSMRRQREFFVEQFGAEKADRVIPEDQIAALEGMAVDEEIEAARDAQPAPAFNAPSSKTPEVTVETKFTQADIDQAIAKTKQESEAQLQTISQRNQQLEYAQRLGQHQSYVQSLIKDDCKVTPAQAAGMAEFLAAIDDATEIEFTAGEGEPKKLGRAAWFKAFLGALPKQLALKTESANTDPAPAEGASFNAPAGYAVHPDKAALDAKARAHMAQHKTDYLTAVRAVGG